MRELSFNTLQLLFRYSNEASTKAMLAHSTHTGSTGLMLLAMWACGQRTAADDSLANKMAALIIGLGADINSPAASGGTPIMKAIHTGRNEIVLLLLAAGARLDVVDRGNNTAVQLVLQPRVLEPVRAAVIRAAAAQGLGRTDPTGMLAGRLNPYVGVLQGYVPASDLPSDSRTCSGCGAISLAAPFKRCTRCKNSFFCSTVCQVRRHTLAPVCQVTFLSSV